MSLRGSVAALVLLTAQVMTAQVMTFARPEQLIEQGARLGQAAAQDLEIALEGNPEDLAARAKLIGYYYYQWMQPGEAATKAARRRHILWLIGHHPEAPLAGLSEA